MYIYYTIFEDIKLKRQMNFNKIEEDIKLQVNVIILLEQWRRIHSITLAFVYKEVFDVIC